MWAQLRSIAPRSMRATARPINGYPRGKVCLGTRTGSRGPPEAFRECVDHIARDDVICAEALGRGAACATVGEDAGAGGLERVHLLREECTDQAREDVARAGGCEAPGGPRGGGRWGGVR